MLRGLFGITYLRHVGEAAFIDARSAVAARAASEEEADAARRGYRGEEARDEWLSNGSL